MTDKLSYTEPHIVSPSSIHTNTVVFLPGRGSDGQEFAEALGVVELQKQAHGEDKHDNIFSRFPGVRWVFPTANPRFSTVFQENLSQWFDIYSLGNPYEKEELQIKGIKESIANIDAILENEIALVGHPGRVVLASISQGEAVALILLLSGKFRLGGFIGFSGWLPFAKHLEAKSHDAIKDFLASMLDLRVSNPPAGTDFHKTSILLGHGRDDAYVAIELAHIVLNILRDLGYPVEWHEYNGADQEGHWLKEPDAMIDMASFIGDICGQSQNLSKR